MITLARRPLRSHIRVESDPKRRTSQFTAGIETHCYQECRISSENKENSGSIAVRDYCGKKHYWLRNVLSIQNLAIVAYPNETKNSFQTKLETKRETKSDKSFFDDGAILTKNSDFFFLQADSAFNSFYLFEPV